MSAKEYDLLKKRNRAAGLSASAWLMRQMETNRPVLFREAETRQAIAFMNEAGREINAIARDFNSGYGTAEQLKYAVRRLSQVYQRLHELRKKGCPQADDEIMRSVLTNQGDRDYRIYEIPTSAITLEGKKIRYFDFISSLRDEGCNRALRRIVPRIDMDKIGKLIYDTPFLSDLQRQFYLTMLAERKAKILDFALEKLEQAKDGLLPVKHKAGKDRDAR